MVRAAKLRLAATPLLKRDRADDGVGIESRCGRAMHGGTRLRRRCQADQPWLRRSAIRAAYAAASVRRTIPSFDSRPET